MKSLLTSLFLGSALYPFCQLQDIEERFQRIENPVEVFNDTTGLSALPPLNFFCTETNQLASDYYHVIDLNADGLNDLIYSGPCRPYMQTAIFLNKGDSLVPIHDWPGTLLAIDKEDGKTVVHLFKESCCCDYYSTLTEITIYAGWGVEKDVISFHVNTAVSIGQPEEITIKGVLRSTPEVNDKKEKDECSGETRTGNHITTIKKEAKVILLDQQGQWSLVLYYEKEQRAIVGWIYTDK